MPSPRSFRLPVWALNGAVLALLCLLVAEPVIAQNIATGRARLRGVVTDLEGNPVADATVTLTFTPTGETFTLTTDDQGRWIKGQMGSGNWTVSVIAGGFLPGSGRARVTQEGRLAPVEIALTPGMAEGAGMTSTFGGALGEKVTAANELYDAADYAGALAAYEAILAEEAAKEEPGRNAHLVYVNAGNSAFELGDYELAGRHYQGTLAVETDNRDARMGMAKVFMMDRRLDEALAELEQIDLSEIRDPIVFYNIGSLLFDQGQSASAQGYYEMAIERDPAFADAYMQLALCLIQQGQMAEAKPHLEKVIELDPESPNGALAQDFLNSIG